MSIIRLPWGENKLKEIRINLLSVPKIIETDFHNDVAYFFDQVLNNKFDAEITGPLDKFEIYHNLHDKGVHFVSNPDKNGLVTIAYDCKKINYENLLRFFSRLGFKLKGDLS